MPTFNAALTIANVFESRVIQEVYEDTMSEQHLCELLGGTYAEPINSGLFENCYTCVFVDGSWIFGTKDVCIIGSGTTGAASFGDELSLRIYAKV